MTSLILKQWLPFILKYLKELPYKLNKVVYRQRFMEEGNTVTAGVKSKQKSVAAHTQQCCPTS